MYLNCCYCHDSSAALRDLWWNRLGQAVKEERDREPKATTIQITYHDAVQAIEYVSDLLFSFFSSRSVT